MNKQRRLENVIKNSALGVIAQGTNVLLSLIVRTVFIRCLSAEYLGINGLFTNILTMLSLAEMGVGSAIVYSMYKPVAESDEVQIAKLMNLYRLAYAVIGCVVAFVGIGLIPFLDVLIRGSVLVDNLTLIYLLFLSNTVFSYFFAYKRSIFSADQHERILHAFRILFHFLRAIVQIVILIVFRNFVLYLIVQIVCTGLENVSISVYADKKYPFLVKYRNKRMTKAERKPIFDNIKALFIYKIGSTVLDGTDNIIISAFDGVISVGLLSNYTLITGSLQSLMSQVVNSVIGSVGNFVAKEKKEKYEGLLNRLTFLYFVIYGMMFIGLYAVMNPFISVWAGPEYVLNDFTVFVHGLNVYIFGMMNSVWTFRSTMGLFVHGRWRPLISAVINVVVSIWWAKYFGLIGVLLGTTFTRVVTNVWYDPFIVYHFGLEKNPYRYYLRWFGYLAVVMLNIFVLDGIKHKLVFEGLLGCFIYGMISVVLFGCMVTAIYARSEEYKYMIVTMRNVLKKVSAKLIR